MARVLIPQPVYADAPKLLRSVGHDVVERNGAPMDAHELARAAAGFEAVLTLLTDTVGEEVFVRNPQLRVVSNVAAGVDNIDLAAAVAHNVTVTNTPGPVTQATADLTMALILATARRVVEGDRWTRDGLPVVWTLKQELMGFDVTGARLGVIGLGRIGSAVAYRARHGFNMEISYLERPLRRPEVAWNLDARPLPLARLLSNSDIVTLHVPLTEETHQLINAEALKTMPSHALLINTSRGPLIDERALAEALRDGLIAGAGLDVYEREPNVDSLLLEQRERVVLLPHIGSATERTRRQMCITAARNALAVLAGESPPDSVTRDSVGSADVVYERRSEGR